MVISVALIVMLFIELVNCRFPIRKCFYLLFLLLLILYGCGGSFSSLQKNRPVGTDSGRREVGKNLSPPELFSPNQSVDLLARVLATMDLGEAQTALEQKMNEVNNSWQAELREHHLGWDVQWGNSYINFRTEHIHNYANYALKFLNENPIPKHWTLNQKIELAVYLDMFQTEIQKILDFCDQVDRMSYKEIAKLNNNPASVKGTANALRDMIENIQDEKKRAFDKSGFPLETRFSRGADNGLPLTSVAKALDGISLGEIVVAIADIKSQDTAGLFNGTATSKQLETAMSDMRGRNQGPVDKWAAQERVKFALLINETQKLNLNKQKTDQLQPSGDFRYRLR